MPISLILIAPNWKQLMCSSPREYTKTPGEYTSNGILVSDKNERTADTQNNMHGSQQHYAEWKKLFTRASVSVPLWFQLVLEQANLIYGEKIRIVVASLVVGVGI